MADEFSPELVADHIGLRLDHPEEWPTGLIDHLIALRRLKGDTAYWAELRAIRQRCPSPTPIEV